MVTEQKLEEIRDDFLDIVKKKEIIGILLFGSFVKDQETNNSDVDICIVAPNEDVFELLTYIAGIINLPKKRYDIRIFSELPLHIKIQVIEDGVLIHSPDKYDLYEYFYRYRKIWNDQKHRHILSKEELLTF